jgi:phosphoglucomutase
MTTRAGLPAQESDLINVEELVAAYYSKVPDVTNPDQRVVFGTDRASPARSSSEKTRTG